MRAQPQGDETLARRGRTVRPWHASTGLTHHHEPAPPAGARDCLCRRSANAQSNAVCAPGGAFIVSGDLTQARQADPHDRFAVEVARHACDVGKTMKRAVDGRKGQIAQEFLEKTGTRTPDVETDYACAACCPDVKLPHRSPMQFL